jgi:hypothetical protein|tara:strand:- start:209 stop:1144 length:936 start_codon:yes stop_codon:yes gene_type:complete
MKLSNYISDLLYRYECVIVPDFGGFITNETSAKVNHFTHTFYPPKKQISFNSHLKNNDGLLANYIASAEKIPFNDAVSKIEKEIQEWNQKIENESIEITKIGSLSLNKDKKIIFEPATSVNYLTSSFGLNSFNSPAIKRLQYKEKAARLEPIVLELDSDEKRNRKAPLFLKYAATAAIIFAVGSFGWKTYNENQYQNQLLAEQVLQESVERKIQQATFVIENPLPAITLNLVKEVQNYHVIAGAFREPGNAQKKVNQLLKKGYDAQILGVNKWNLTQVSYGSFSDRLDALQNLRTIKRTVASDAWLLVKEF